MTDITLSILAAVLLLPGIIMAVVPGLPGHIYMLIVAMLFAIVTNLSVITPMNLIVLSIVTFVSILLDVFSGIAGAKYGGAHWSSLVAGVVGLLVGTIVIPVPIIGSVAGLFIGVFLHELYRGRDVVHARKAATGSFIGSVIGIAGMSAMAILFFILFVSFLFF